MSEDSIFALWIVFLLAGTGIAALGCGYIVIRYRSGGGKEKSFLVSALIEFVASYVLYIPAELSGLYRSGRIPGADDVIYVVTASVVKTISIVSGNGFEAAEFANHTLLTNTYGIVRSIVCLLLMGFISGFFIKVFEGPLQNILVTMSTKGNTYLFSSLNEKTMVIAKSLPPKSKVVFIGSRNNSDCYDDDKFRGLKLCFVDKTIGIVLRRIVRREDQHTEVFLFSEEEDNVVDLDKVLTIVQSSSKAKLKVYVELTNTPWSLFNYYCEEIPSVKEGRVSINFIRVDENFAYNNLITNSIFENFVLSDAIRRIHILIIGNTGRCQEMLKAVLWLGQMPGYKMCVTMIDSADNERSFKQKMPEVRINEPYNIDGDAEYEFYYFGGVCYDSVEVEDIVEKRCIDMTFGYINIGSDIDNLNMSVRINAIMQRHDRGNSYTLQADIINTAFSRNWNNVVTGKIQAVGGDESTYDYLFITNYRLEAASRKIHSIRYPREQYPDKTWNNYYSDEYSRHAVYSRTLSIKQKLSILEAQYGSNYSLLETEEWMKYEHMRWNMYTRVNGYRMCDETMMKRLSDKQIRNALRNMAKVHNSLISFYDLSEEEQKKDAVAINEDVISVLRDI